MEYPVFSLIHTEFLSITSLDCDSYTTCLVVQLGFEISAIRFVVSVPVQRIWTIMDPLTSLPLREHPTNEYYMRSLMQKGFRKYFS
jgi:hypothetical protein